MQKISPSRSQLSEVGEGSGFEIRDAEKSCQAGPHRPLKDGTQDNHPAYYERDQYVCGEDSCFAISVVRLCNRVSSVAPDAAKKCSGASRRSMFREIACRNTCGCSRFFGWRTAR